MLRVLLLLLFNNYYLVRVTYLIFKIIPLAAASRCGRQFCFLLFNQTQNSSPGCTESVSTDISSRLERFQILIILLYFFTAYLLRKLVENPHKMYVMALGYFFTKSPILTWATCGSLEARV